jgi:hypothetical protein
MFSHLGLNLAAIQYIRVSTGRTFATFFVPLPIKEFTMKKFAMFAVLVACGLSLGCGQADAVKGTIDKGADKAKDVAKDTVVGDKADAAIDDAATEAKEAVDEAK